MHKTAININQTQWGRGRAHDHTTGWGTVCFWQRGSQLSLRSQALYVYHTPKSCWVTNTSLSVAQKHKEKKKIKEEKPELGMQRGENTEELGIV